MIPFAARVLVLCALGLLTLGAAPPKPLDQFLAAMRDAAGPVWNAHFISISRVTYNGMASTVSTDSQGIAFTLRRCNGELCDGTYFDGVRLYSVDYNDTALPQSGKPEPYLRALRAIATLAFLGPGYSSQGGRVHDTGLTEFHGAKYRTLLVTDPKAISLRLYVDQQTALLRYARDVGGDDTFEYRDYRHINGFTVPFEVMHNGSVLEKYDDRTPVTPPFRAPRGLVPAFDGPPEAVALDPNHVTPVFACKIGGVDVRCLLDTGNSGISMSSELAARLGAPVVGEYRVRGLGDYSTQVVRGGPLQIGNATFADPTSKQAYYVVLNDVAAYGYDVVVGTDILASTDVRIDSVAHTIRFGAATPSTSITVPLTFENFVPVVDVRLGNVPTQLLVDTGDESNINLAYAFYLSHQSLFTVTTRRPVKGVGGASVELLGSIPQVTVGNYTTGPQTIGTTQSLQNTAFGHLGAAFLEQFDVDLDYSAAELHLIPRA